MVQRFPPEAKLRHDREQLERFRYNARYRHVETLREVVQEYSRAVDHARKHPGLEWADTVECYEQIITIALTELLTRDTK